MVRREVATLVHHGVLNGNLGGVHGPDDPWEICRHHNRNMRKDIPEGGSHAIAGRRRKWSARCARSCSKWHA